MLRREETPTQPHPAPRNSHRTVHAGEHEREKLERAALLLLAGSSGGVLVRGGTGGG